jgi:hypothetical protein
MVFSQTDCRSDIYSLGVILEKFTKYMSMIRKNIAKRLLRNVHIFLKMEIKADIMLVALDFYTQINYNLKDYK